jgi:tRNA (guanine-N7-)-methyltransferase
VVQGAPPQAPRHRARSGDTIADQLRPGGELHAASDVFEVGLEILAVLEDCPRLKNLAGPWSFWRGNPFDAASRREQTTLARGQRVWRTRFVLT